ncbi:MAG: ABC transporter ATP-binding protein [Lachnospiraceae bacterium]|nr:ABC transporter ATP-binding protein [Lachnospiraceae bacterium]
MKVELQHLTKIFPGRDKKNPVDVTAVNDMNFEIPDGKLVGLLGPSGCGKSTALNLISGLEVPTEGRVFFGTDDVTELPPEHRGIGLVFQSYALYPHLNVRQNIRFPLENLKGEQKMSREAMEAAVLEAARVVQIGDLLDRKPAEMSGGQQQRVAIARALVKKPKVLLLDEPLSNLDARLRLQTREEIRRIQRETGITTVFVTHDQEEAMSISDLMVVMKEGKVQQIGPPQEIYDSPVNLFVAKFLGTPQINIFEGKVQDERLIIGVDDLMQIKAVPDRKVLVGIRPEGFILKESGAFRCTPEAVEVMGRDSSIVFGHMGSVTVQPRAIIDSDNPLAGQKDHICFDVKPRKVFLFDPDSGERISFL